MRGVCFKKNLLKSPDLAHFLTSIEGSIFLLTDEKVASLYLSAFERYFSSYALPLHSMIIKGGEASKSRETKSLIEDQMVSAKCDKDTLLIAFGGGVITDLGGFVAATFYRGIRYVSIPTTLLGMVDASIGGKTGINLPEGKNLIGAHYAPLSILIDSAFLKTLPENEFISGTAEVIKYGLIANRGLIETLRKKRAHWMQREQPLIEEILKMCVHLKLKIVKRDPLDRGKRRMLNFGHTIGHAIETLLNYKISHGEAIAIGMVGEAKAALNLGLLSHQEFQDLYDLVKEFAFSLKLSASVTSHRLLERMKKDKKAKGGELRIVLLKKVGKVEKNRGEYCASIPERELQAALNWMIEECRR